MFVDSEDLELNVCIVVSTQWVDSINWVSEIRLFICNNDVFFFIYRFKNSVCAMYQQHIYFGLLN